MSVAVAIKSAEGIVIAADSRVTVKAKTGDGREVTDWYDSGNKLFSFRSPMGDVAAAAFGRTKLDNRLPREIVLEYEQQLADGDHCDMDEIVKGLAEHFAAMFKRLKPPPGEDMIFFVAGYNTGEPFGRLYEFAIPSRPKPVEKQKGTFGLLWGGDQDVISRLVIGYDGRLIETAVQALHLSPKQTKTLKQAFNEKLSLITALDGMPLQESIDYAAFLVGATIELQRWNIGQRTCGGPIDVLAITPEKGLIEVQSKRLKVEE